MSSPVEGSEQRIGIIVGLPPSVRPRLEQEFKGRLVVRVIPMRRDGGYILEPPPSIARRLIEQFSDQADYANVALILLPYVQIPPEVTESADLLAELGVTVIRPATNQSPWPARPRFLDNEFQKQLLAAICQTLEAFLPPVPIGQQDEIIEDILRGLVTHSKMGPTNHSHEDDLWKSRGQALGPGERRRVVRFLLAEGLVGRKQNDSAGGKGWVYWIADVSKVRARCPALDPYFSS